MTSFTDKMNFYVLHKLIIVGEREGAFLGKSRKDLVRGGLLLSARKETRSWGANLFVCGMGWLARAQRGLVAFSL